MTYQEYVKLGWPVFPVAGPTYAEDKEDYKTWKKPLVAWKTYQKRMPTETEIASWQKKWPHAWIGCITGPISNLFVIDVDGQQGLQSLSRLNYEIPETRAAGTRRGFHYFFKWNTDLDKYLTTISDIADGIDIRGKGGYVIVPSTTNPEREWKYLVDPAELPKVWYSLLTPASSNGTSLNISEKINGLKEGNRHDTFMRLIGKLMSAKLDASDVIVTLMPLATEQNFEQDLIDLVNDMFARYTLVPKISFKAGLASDILKLPEPKLEWLIESMWVNQSNGLIAGIPGVGKTWVALDMLFSVATGLPCLGKYQVHNQGPVLIVEEEGSLFGLSRRIHMLARGRQLQADAMSNFHHITRQFIDIIDHEKTLIEFVKSKGIKFIVFDSLRQLHKVDENSSDKMKPVLTAFSRLGLETSASVLLIHHLRKQNDTGKTDKRSIFERVRGTSSIHAWRDCILGIEGEEDASVCHCNFQFRDAESTEPITIKRIYDKLDNSIRLEAEDLDESELGQDKMQLIVEYVRKNGPVFKDQVCNKAGGRKRDNIRFFNAAVHHGLLVKHGYKWHVPEFTGTSGNVGT